MPSLKDIRRRIVSIKNTQKITRAMKLVSAAKFARANSAIVAARPYAKAFKDMQDQIMRLARAKGVRSEFLENKPEKNSLVVFVSTDRGFCGSLNSNLFKSTLRFAQKKEKSGIKIDFYPWGKRARLFAQKQNLTLIGSKEAVLDKLTYKKARDFGNELVQIFAKGQYDRIYISFVEFRSALVQQPTVIQLLPFDSAEENSGESDANKSLIIEPGLEKLQTRLLERSICSQIFRVLLESAASEHGARMTAMDSATNNASEVLRKMNIQYARARQAAITKELIEITSGADALGN